MSWRDTLFRWQGTLDEKSNYKGKWKGIGIERDDDGDDGNAFGGKRISSISSCVLSGAWKTWYMLDGKKHWDNPPYTLKLIENQRDVVGKGENEFGHFVIWGDYEQDAHSLTLNRRYMDDDDARVAMDLEEITNHSKEDILSVTFRNVSRRQGE